MTIFKHMIENLFVTATGIAALIHSTWSLGTLFAGSQPDPSTNMLGFLGWIIPALLIAFALDIGQIYTSAEIRHGDKRAIKYLTFFVFAAATYYLQWLYMVHHIPALALEAGVRPEWQASVTLMRDMAIWIVPTFLPLSTAMYTLSQGSDPGPSPRMPYSPGFDPHQLPTPEIIEDDDAHIVKDDPNIGLFDEDTEPIDAVTMPAIIEGTKSVARSVRVEVLNKECEHCNKVIKNARPNQKYCTVICRTNAYKARQKA